MKTTFDLPPDLLERSKIVAAKRRISLKKLVIEGLEAVIAPDVSSAAPEKAFDRLKRGYRLGGKSLTREDAHAR